MIRLLFPVAAALALLSGCGVSVIDEDMSTSSPYGCRAPSACYAPNCNCLRASVTTMWPNGCLVCDPADPANPMQNCVCNDVDDGGTPIGPTNQQCVEQVELCIGAAATACPGVGARCLPAGSTCDQTGGDPPAIVQLATEPDGGAGTEQRCNFTDDVCCPGTAPPPDLAPPVDQGAPQDLAVPDLANPTD